MRTFPAWHFLIKYICEHGKTSTEKTEKDLVIDMLNKVPKIMALQKALEQSQTVIIGAGAGMQLRGNSIFPMTGRQKSPGRR